jgi:hypothetical protein
MPDHSIETSKIQPQILFKNQKKLGQLDSLATTTNAFSDIQRKVNQPPHIVPTLTSCSARHKNGGPTNVHLPTRVRQGHLGI